MKQTRVSKRRRNRVSSTPHYSTFNLYLVYLALPDLLYSLYRIGTNVRAGEWKSKSRDPSLSLVTPYLYINLWINAIVAYEVLGLLKASRSAQRVEQPSVRRVTLQAGSVYLCSDTYSMVAWVTVRVYSGNTTFLTVIYTVAIVAPILYVVYASFLVWCRSYLPSLHFPRPPSVTSNSSISSSTSAVRDRAVRDRALRVLAVYFFRVIYVFLAVWLPGIVLYALSYFAPDGGTRIPSGWIHFVGSLTSAIQAMTTEGLGHQRRESNCIQWA